MKVSSPGVVACVGLIALNDPPADIAAQDQALSAVHDRIARCFDLTGDQLIQLVSCGSEDAVKLLNERIEGVGCGSER